MNQNKCKIATLIISKQFYLEQETRISISKCPLTAIKHSLGTYKVYKGIKTSINYFLKYLGSF